MRRTALLCIAVLLLTTPAQAYRPFDATDASVAELGELELEVGPVGYLRTQHQSHFAPAEVINYGVAKRIELVLQGRELLAPQVGSRFGLVDNGAFIKGVLREGGLQDKSGLSIATEIGALLPTFHSEPGAGFSAAVIFSDRFSFASYHLNLQGLRLRDGNPDFFGSLITEGPSRWRVRPVVEVFLDRELAAHTTYSALVGFIAQMSSELALDAGGRIASLDAMPIFEVRAGFTLAIPVWR